MGRLLGGSGRMVKKCRRHYRYAPAGCFHLHDHVAIPGGSMIAPVLEGSAHVGYLAGPKIAALGRFVGWCAILFVLVRCTLILFGVDVGRVTVNEIMPIYRVPDQFLEGKSLVERFGLLDWPIFLMKILVCIAGMVAAFKMIFSIKPSRGR